MNSNKNYYVDYFGRSATQLKKKKLFLFDMDGTIYEDDNVFDGTHQIIRYIRSIEGKYIFVTNNSSKSVSDYVKKVNRLGIDADENNFFTSAQATILYLKNNYSGAKVYCQGTKSLIEELSDSGISVTEQVEDDINVVVVGFDTEITGAKLRNTCEILSRENIPFIATNPDLRCPVSFGYIPDCGSICRMIESATDRKPVYIGKPESVMVDIVRQKLGYSREETVVIGDRLYTDILTGINAGVDSVCVLSGEATAEDIQNGNIKPAFTFNSVKELWECMII